MADRKVYKIVLIGDDKVGKTTMVKRIRTGEFKEKYVHTLGVEVTPLTFQTSDGNYVLNIWDVAKSRDDSQYFVDADGWIVMFDVHNYHSYISAFNDATYAKETGKPMVICANKVDEPGGMDYAKIEIGRRFDCRCILTSYKSNYNFEKPFLELIRAISGKKDINLTIL